ncbi:MAG TPA: VanZ family protein [Cytophagaceae bacterium]
MPGKYLPETSLADFFKIDKLVHISIFLGLVYLLIKGLKRKPSSGWATRYAIIFSLLLGTLYGALIEVIQQFIPDRSFEYLDMLANTLGCIAGAFIFSLQNKNRKSSLS